MTNDIRVLIAAGSLGTFFKTLFSVQSDYKAAFKSNLILLIILVVTMIIIAILTISLDPNIKWGSLQADLIWAQVLTAIIILLVYFLVGLIPGIGFILVIILMIVLAVLKFFGIDLEKILANFVLALDPIVGLDTDMGNSDMGLDDPDLGFTAGNTLQWSFIMTTTAKHQQPSTWPLKNKIRGNTFQPYDKDDIPVTSVHWELGTEYTKDIEVELKDRWSDWSVPQVYTTYTYQDRHKELHTLNLYSAWLTDSLRTNDIPLEAGVNVEVKAFLNMGYDMLAVECWFLGLVCNKKHVGAGHPEEKDAEITVGVFDIFPKTLDEFYAWNWNTNPAFALPAPMDHDNDGLISAAYVGGLVDPDDNNWDVDGDTLSDYYEMTMNTYPPDQGGAAYNWLKADTDGDGLRDDEEARLGTNPASADSDGDGRSDYEEVRGYAFIPCQF